MRARANRRVAQLHANKLARLLGESETPFAEVDVPLQQNMYDCGMLSCLAAQLLRPYLISIVALLIHTKNHAKYHGKYWLTIRFDY